MWCSLIVCMLFVGALAAPPQPCCGPRYFTYKQVATTTSVVDGSLLVEYETSESAYDAISEKISTFFDVDYFNGTEIYGRLIADFKQDVVYHIIKHGDDEDCFLHQLGFKFPENCIPDDGKFVKGLYLGDHDLRVDTWYYSRPYGSSELHIAKTVGHEECIPVSIVYNEIDKETGENLKLADYRTIDFNLGICDRDRFFKIPDVCKPDRALTEPTPEMLTIMHKQSLRRF